MSLSVLPALTDADLALAFAIRRAVFVEEQGVAAEHERDGLDDQCQHFLARLSSLEAVAAARARTTPRGWKIERVAVAQPHRGRSVGAALVRRMQAEAPAGLSVYVHAQESALRFWERMGFVAEGPRFFEAGIPHYRMVWAERAPAR